ncbi:hypothetical protein [Aminipila terrae]|uniref:Uncharacterized protein n=1 Tax=Aminipila terrae TaxID=2697030 RepID=A0A6P1MBK7_9FIRM|nr:hypothetical protein [Aminipila terrae]QHI71307.1 hypothetical protein Ami3637_01850 [Aminipila terrae]
MKKAKWVLLIIVSLIIILTMGILLYIFVGENSDTKTSQKEVEGMTNVIIQEIDSKIKGDEGSDKLDINSNSEQIASPEGIEAKEQENKNGIAQKQTQNMDGKEKQILSIYDSAFYELQNSANGMVDGLLAGIKSDYSALKANNEASLDKMMKLGASYTKRANALEKQVDSSVSTILDKMESDMANQGISSEKIKAYRQAYEAEYKKQKETRRNAVMSKAKEFM